MISTGTFFTQVACRVGVREKNRGTQGGRLWSLANPQVCIRPPLPRCTSGWWEKKQGFAPALGLGNFSEKLISKWGLTKLRALVAGQAATWGFPASREFWRTNHPWKKGGRRISEFQFKVFGNPATNIKVGDWNYQGALILLNGPH